MLRTLHHKWAEVLGLKCAPGEFIFTALSPFRLIITIHFDGSLFIFAYILRLIDLSSNETLLVVGRKINAENERLFMITGTETDLYVRAFLRVISSVSARVGTVWWNLINFYINLCKRMQIKF